MTHLCWYGGRGGSGGYFRYLKGALGSGAIPGEVRVSLLCSEALVDRLGTLDPQVECVTIPWLATSLGAKVWERTRLAGYLRRRRPDVFFHASGSLVRTPPEIASVAACHSLLFFDGSEYRKYAGSWMWFRYLRPMRRLHYTLYPRMAGVIFFTPYSRALVTRAIPGIERDVTIAHGVEPEFVAETPVPTVVQPPRNILYVSSVNLFKHQWNVVKAVKHLRERSGVDYQLSLAGSSDAVADRVLRRCLDAEQARPFTHLLGHVEHSDLRKLYRAADLFVYASSCESFGITLLEAMASGLPVACSSRSGLPELLQDAGEYFDPEDPQDIAAAIERLAMDPDRRQRGAEQGIRYARNYTWRRCADRTLAFLGEVAGLHAGRRRMSHRGYKGR